MAAEEAVVVEVPVKAQVEAVAAAEEVKVVVEEEGVVMEAVQVVHGGCEGGGGGGGGGDRARSHLELVDPRRSLFEIVRGLAGNRVEVSDELRLREIGPRSGGGQARSGARPGADYGEIASRSREVVTWASTRHWSMLCGKLCTAHLGKGGGNAWVCWG